MTRNVRAFVRVAALTAQCEIVSYSQTTMFFCDDVINLEGKQGNICRNLAILTSLRRPLPDKLP